jgi:hypothetical protein
MAATATRGKTSGNTKQSAASKRSSTSRREEGPMLHIRYPKRMKPGRVYGLTVSMPSNKKRRRDEEDAERGALVVVRPVIAGALVTPAEQRFEAAPGNQITFHVTPLARGKLPRARLEVYAPGQPPETIPLGMKAKTQRLALFLLILAWLVPTCMIQLTKGDWKPGARGLHGHFAEPMKRDLPPVPVFNEPVSWVGDEKFTVADTTADFLSMGWNELDTAMDKWRWLPNAVGAGFIFLAFVAFVFNKPARKTIKRPIDLPADTPESREAAELQPI